MNDFKIQDMSLAFSFFIFYFNEINNMIYKYEISNSYKNKLEL